jgi:hypothetical protein
LAWSAAQDRQVLCRPSADARRTAKASSGIFSPHREHRFMVRA